MDFKHNKRLQRRAVLGAALAAGLLIPLTSAMAPADTVLQVATGQGGTCTPAPLPAPAGTFSAVLGGDPTGRYLVGSVTYPDERRTGALWQDGQFTEIDASSIQSIQIDYHDVNSDGVVVGERMTDYSSFHTDAFTYQNGTFTFLPALNPGDSTQALGINSRGDIVGNSSGNGWTPVVWPADQPGTVRVLPMPAGHAGDGRALGIDEDGSVVGYLSPYPPGTPYLWPANGNPGPLPLPAGSQGGIAVAIQGGMVAGSVSDPATTATVPALWNLSAGGVTSFSTVQGAAYAVNSQGTLGVAGAVVHANGQVVPVASGALVTTVADTGEAAGSTREFSGNAVRWTGC